MTVRGLVFISTHTPLAGRGVCLGNNTTDTEEFLLTRPSRGAAEIYSKRVWVWHISTHTPLAGRGRTQLALRGCCQISTHTPLAGRGHIGDLIWSEIIISTHTPLAGRGNRSHLQDAIHPYFYSHAPRGARLSRCNSTLLLEHFYSHAPRGARPTGSGTTEPPSNFYSHAPRGARRFFLLI